MLLLAIANVANVANKAAAANIANTAAAAAANAGVVVTVIVAVDPESDCEQPAADVALVTEYVVVDVGDTVTVLEPPAESVVLTVLPPFQ